MLVGDSVQPLQVLGNTIQADWTSLPGRDTALNSTGQIGEDGAADGMRIGALPNAGNALNDYEAEASDSVYVPPLAITKTDLEPALPPEIGAHKSFEVTIDLPEGESNAVSLTDELATGSVSYFLADNADYDVTYEFAGIASINGQAPSEAAFNAVPADGANGTAAWDIGAIVIELLILVLFFVTLLANGGEAGRQAAQLMLGGPSEYGRLQPECATVDHVQYFLG